MEFPRQKYWSELPFRSPRDLPDPETEPTSPTMAGGFFLPLASWGALGDNKEQNHFHKYLLST